jgi:hypothetical protein
VEDELVELVSLACRALKSTVDALGEKQKALQQKLAKARADLRDQGGRIRTMDAFELRHEAKMGLVDQAAADEELVRHREAFRTAPSRHFLASDAAVGGFLICDYAGCYRQVPAAEGQFCFEHKQQEPRTYFTPTYQFVNLDDLLQDAQRRHAKARAELDQASAEIRELERHRAQ